MALLGTCTLAGQSGSEYPFKVYEKGTLFNDFIAGIYVLCKRADDGSIESVAHIGGTEHIFGTLAKHPQQSCLDESGYNAVLLHRNANADAQNKAVADLVATHSPTWQD